MDEISPQDRARFAAILAQHPLALPGAVAAFTHQHKEEILTPAQERERWSKSSYSGLGKPTELPFPATVDQLLMALDTTPLETVPFARFHKTMLLNVGPEATNALLAKHLVGKAKEAAAPQEVKARLATVLAQGGDPNKDATLARLTRKLDAINALPENERPTEKTVEKLLGHAGMEAFHQDYAAALLEQRTPITRYTARSAKGNIMIVAEQNDKATLLQVLPADTVTRLRTDAKNHLHMECEKAGEPVVFSTARVDWAKTLKDFEAVKNDVELNIPVQLEYKEEVTQTKSIPVGYRVIRAEMATGSVLDAREVQSKMSAQHQIITLGSPEIISGPNNKWTQFRLEDTRTDKPAIITLPSGYAAEQRYVMSRFPDKISISPQKITSEGPEFTFTTHAPENPSLEDTPLVPVKNSASLKLVSPTGKAGALIPIVKDSVFVLDQKAVDKTHLELLTSDQAAQDKGKGMNR